MTKTYFNDAVVGNSSMLGCLTGKGELVRLFWPNIDYPQHIDRMLCGIFYPGQHHSTMWINEEGFKHSQSYIKDTNILKTEFINYEKGISIQQVDFVLPYSDVLVRRYEIENTANYEVELGFMLFSAGITTTPHMGNILFDFSNDALVHYKHNYYISISADIEAYQFQLGNYAYEAARYTELRGNDNIGMMFDGATSWKLGVFQPRERKSFSLYICAAHSLKSVRKLTSDTKLLDISAEQKSTEEYWRNFINDARHISTGREEVDNLYKRSLLVFKLMSDKKTGGLLAAPEIDEGFTKCGRYAYCWGRDAAFITEALDKCGLTNAVEKFYQWAVEVQDEDGSWHQRYHMDGNLAPSWGLQIDETGTIIWGMLKHYEITRNAAFLHGMWGSIEKGVFFMLNFVDTDTGLPKPSFDLWEERFGEHAYSSAAVYGGIKAGVEMGRVLGKSEDMLSKWEDAAEKIKAAIIMNLWKEDRHTFIRSVRTKLNPWGTEHSEHTSIIKINSKNNFKDVTLEDGTVDISLLGLRIPFGVLDAQDPRIVSTVENLEHVLTAHGVGGLRRYENDNYIGGNPWVLTTLWAALYHIEKQDYAKAIEYFEWAVKARTYLDLLPEQVDKDTGKPAWVIPLTWSHAMFVLVLIRLVEVGAI